MGLQLTMSDPIIGGAMLKIGEFASAGGVSVRMLRHYDQLGLLTRPRSIAGTGAPLCATSGWAGCIG